jgi:hypothetical protein
MRCVVSRHYTGTYRLHRRGRWILDDGGSKRLWNIDQLLRDYTAQCPRSFSPSSNLIIRKELQIIQYGENIPVRRKNWHEQPAQVNQQASEAGKDEGRTT